VDYFTSNHIDYELFDASLNPSLLVRF